MSRDDALLLDIREAGRRIVEFGHGLTDRDLADDPKALSAVLYQITVLGEAVKRLSPAFKDAHPEVPWKEVAGMRDRVIHDYRRVDLQIVSDVINHKVPSLLDQIEPLVP